MLSGMAKPKDIDAYLATVSAEKRALLQTLRTTIHALVPHAEECISYSMPAFRVKGGVVAGFLATRSGCSYFPFSGTTLATLAHDVAAFDRTKSALHFGREQPLTRPLVRKLLQARLAEIAKPTKRPKRPGTPRSGRQKA